MSDKVFGCTRCPYAGHIELKECLDAYTDKAPKCSLYDKHKIPKGAHTIVMRAVTPSMVKIQIEDWREVYPEVYTTNIIGAYPTAKQTGRYGIIRRGNSFRLSLDKFKTDEEVMDIFNSLKAGRISFEDLSAYMDDKGRYYLGLIDEEPEV